MVEILRKGNIRENRAHTVQCNDCKSELRYRESEVKVTHGQRDGSFITFTCPVCNRTGHSNYSMSYRGSYYRDEKENNPMENVLDAISTELVFLGGTCGNSKWREELIPMLEIDYFNPVVPDWNEEAYQKELFMREHCDYCLYVLTPETDGLYSIAEVVDDSNKRPEKTVLVILSNYGAIWTSNQEKSINRVGKMVHNNGGKVFSTLKSVANYLNNR